MDAVIFDCDGTLVDVRAIRHYVTGKVRNFHKFHTESVNCPPNADVVEAAHQAHRDGLKVLIVTAREDTFGTHTAFWLAGQALHYDELYMRPKGDYRPDYVVKKDILDQIRKDGYDVVHAYDDNPNVIRLWQEEGIPTTVVAGFGFDE